MTTAGLLAHVSIAGGDRPERPAEVPAGRWRRYDVHTRWAVRAVDSLRTTHPDLHLEPGDGLVVATAYGAAVSTKRFVDSIAAYGDAAASPTPFTTSVHNTTAGCLGEWLGLRGPCTTISQGAVSTTAALRWATLQLAADRCGQVLVICGEALEDWSRKLVRELEPSPWPLGEGMTALLLGTTGGRQVSLLPPEDADGAVCLDNGGLDAAAQRLAKATAGRQRRSRPVEFGDWWPTCTLHWPDGLPTAPLQVVEADGFQLGCCWIAAAG